MFTQNIVGADREGLYTYAKEVGLASYRVDQVWSWIYQRGVTSFEDMSNLSQRDKSLLAQSWYIGRPKLGCVHAARDGTQKWLLQFVDANEVEVVHIPEKDRGTLCVSSQVGCVLNCSFCHTGTQDFVRNLKPSEIVGQYMLARDMFAEWGQAHNSKRHVSNIVFMGMGEPLYNYAHVAQSIRCMIDPSGLGLSRRRITLSTSGLVPEIDRCGKELGVNLAVSLHAVTDDVRDQLVPINRKYPIEDLLAACRRYPLGPGRRITFEYVMLKDVNDGDADARGLVQLLRGIPAKINLIPFNVWPGSGYTCSTTGRISAFGHILEKAGYPCPVRRARGDHILAACGQLKSRTRRGWGQRVPLRHMLPTDDHQYAALG